MSTIKILSWNVNGLRSVLKKGYVEFFKKEKPAILCVQETRSTPDQVDFDALDEDFQPYKKFWNPADKKGYSGTLVISQWEPKSVKYGMGIKEHDEIKEGRLITCEYDDFGLVNCYTPNSQQRLKRLEYRKQWDKDFIQFVLDTKKELKKPLIICGDLSVAHKPMDVARIFQNPQNENYADAEREGFDKLLDQCGLTDTYRYLNKDREDYTFWTFPFFRERSLGWRVDYFLCDARSLPAAKASYVVDSVPGSDHCPIGFDLDLSLLKR